MDTGLLIRWGQILPGREDAAIALFEESVTYFLSLMENGKITSFEPFLFTMADVEEEQGFFLVKGAVPEIFALMDSDEYKTFMTKANLLLRPPASEHDERRRRRDPAAGAVRKGPGGPAHLTRLPAHERRYGPEAVDLGTLT